MKFLILALTFLLSACSSHFESSTQVDSKAYLLLTGNFSGAVLTVDEQPAVSLDSNDIKQFSKNGSPAIKFEIKKGSHKVIITRSGKIVVKRLIYVSDGNSAEVIVP